MTISTNSMASDAESIENRLHGVRPEIDSLREVGALFYQRGWSVGTSSNYSVVLQRDPVQLLVTASGKDKG
ncbi:MAG: class II aldolase/adducin family protein, partial [Planctomycetales bacterium]|nr:class II aldolase/adducin family protein [Planctomycetales bacterium]